MTVMHRLYLKGFLNRTLRSKAHYYEPRVEFTDVRDAVVSGVIRHFFRGSRDEFLQFLESDDGRTPGSQRPQPLWTKLCSEIYASLTGSCTTNTQPLNPTFRLLRKPRFAPSWSRSLRDSASIQRTFSSMGTTRRRSRWTTCAH